MSVLETFSPQLEIYSIDEAFIVLKGFDYFDLKVLAGKIIKEVWRQVGMPVCVGVAPTRILCKVANRIAKKFPQLNGTHIIDSEDERLKALKWLKAKDLWGLNKGFIKRMQFKNINTSIDFTKLDDKLTQRNLSVVGLKLKKNLKELIQNIQTIY